MKRLSWSFAILFCLVLAGCISPSRKDAYQTAVSQYSAAIRWEGLLAGAPYTDPMVLTEAPLTGVEISRYQQFRVSGYNVLAETEDPQGHRIREVQIGLINLNTLAERVIRHREEWRWDPTSERWLLMSLPPSLD
jgi:hypothetical protein